MTAANRSNSEAVSRALDLKLSLLPPAFSRVDSDCPSFRSQDRSLWQMGAKAMSATADAIIKIFSIACVLLMLPVLVAMVQAMNFKHKLEPEWVLGHPSSILPMIASSVTPFFFFRWKAWL